MNCPNRLTPSKAVYRMTTRGPIRHRFFTSALLPLHGTRGRDFSRSGSFISGVLLSPGSRDLLSRPDWHDSYIHANTHTRNRIYVDNCIALCWPAVTEVVVLPVELAYIIVAVIKEIVVNNSNGTSTNGIIIRSRSNCGNSSCNSNNSIGTAVVTIITDN